VASVKNIRVLIFVSIFLVIVSTGVGSLEDGLEGYWRFNSGTGNELVDSAGGIDGDINGASWTSGKFSDGLFFDGNGDYIGLSDWSVIDGSSSLSVSTWINPSSLSYTDDGHFSNHAQIIGKQGPSSDDNYELALLDTGEIGVYVDNGNSVQITGGSLNTNEWYHITSTYGNGKLELYINGDKVSSTSASGSLVTNTHPLEFGGDSTGNYGGDNYYWFNGKMDETRVYSKELTTSDVQELYNYRESFCDKTGPNQECILNSERDISGQSRSINNVFLSRKSASIKSNPENAILTISNTSKISGIWTGNFEIKANTITLTSGAKFNPRDKITLNSKK